MALTATIFNLTIELADMDRGVYETLEIRIARQPSETDEYMLTRVLAYCLEFAEGIELTEGVAAGDQPAVLIRDLTGRVTAWIEVGMPDASRLNRGMKLAGRAAVYTHRDARKLVAQIAGERIHRGPEIPIYSLDPRFVEQVASLLDRRSELTMSVIDRELYIRIAEEDFTTPIVEHRL